MERDFMGLNSTDALAALVKKEVAANGYEDSVYLKRSAGQFPFPNKILSDSSQQVAVPIGNSFKNHFPAADQNSSGTTTKLHGGISVTAPHTGGLPIGSVPVGITDFSVKPRLSTSQLTIFYAGTVNVFDDISPEKAQAIMLLAGKYVISSASKDKVESSSTKVATDGGVQNQPMNFNQLTAPQARRVSLARFLEKRKLRVMNVAPYSTI